VPISESDPRVYFAAERTLLAWLRTGLTVMAFGFVIARFGLLLQVQAHAVVQHAQAGVSALIGIALVGAGTAIVIAATVQHRKFIATLPQVDRPLSYSGGALILASSVLIAVAGIVLIAYLALAAG